ncbi:MAG: hypothetical protein L0Z51_07865 [Candidatus Latescibacteria bacterium]|nr:hypothetical protein [Candidatus Latescibacterota bacterium]
MAFVFKLIVGYLIAAATVIWAFGFDLQTGLNLLLLLVPFLTSLVRHVPRVYLFFSRVRYAITNQETAWRLSLEFYGTFSSEDVSTFVRELVEEGPEQNALIQTVNGLHTFRYHKTSVIEIALDDPAVGVSAGPAVAGRTLSITVFDQKVSYRSSTRMIEQTLVPLFERLQTEFKPDRGKYALHIAFDGPNPFFGLYAQQMNLDCVREFTFVFTIPTANKTDYVRVEKGDMTVVSSTLEGLRQAARTCLTFSGVTRS